MDEAKTYAAEYTLQTLGIPTDGGDTGTAAAAATSATVFPGMEKGNHARNGNLQRVFGNPFLVPWTQGLLVNSTYNDSYLNHLWTKKEFAS